MQPTNKNKGTERPISESTIRSVKLYDIDNTIYEYMGHTVVPELELNGTKIKVPILYGNAERWAGARKDGYLRDVRGNIQLPLIMFKRNSIERDSSLAQFKEVNTLPAYQLYSKKNRYDSFSIHNGIKPIMELYNIPVPDYITVSYEVMMWAGFTHHMNQLVEAFQYATDRYWGTENRYKFRVRIDSFDNQQEVGEGTERIIRTTFTMVVNAYLLPEYYGNSPNIRKSLTPRRVVFGVETVSDASVTTLPKIYNQYQTVIDFMAINNTQRISSNDIFTNGFSLTSVKLPLLPPELVGSFDVRNWFSVYINTEFKPSDTYTYQYNDALKSITFTFQNLGFDLDGTDEIHVVGKFIKI